MHLVFELCWEEGEDCPKPQPSSQPWGLHVEHTATSLGQPWASPVLPPAYPVSREETALAKLGSWALDLWGRGCSFWTSYTLCAGGGFSHQAWAEACDPTAGIFLAFSLTECFQISLLLTSKENESVFFSSQSESLLQNIKVSMINVSCALKL